MRAPAIGLFAAAGLALAIPASAEEFRIGVPGIGVEIGSGNQHRDRDYDRGYRRTEGYDRYEAVERCRTTIIRADDGSVRKIRRCRD